MANKVLEIKFGAPGGREDGEHNGDDFVEIHMISAMQDAFSFEVEAFDRAWYEWRPLLVLGTSRFGVMTLIDQFQGDEPG